MLVRKCLMGALVGMSGGFIVGLIGAFVVGPIVMVLPEGENGATVDILSWALLVSVPTGTLIGIVVPIRAHLRRRRAAKAEDEETRRQE